ncbi:MAG: hypothetical protein JWQ30_171 [Sediminibacterium sp.]|nr:hypothetical protein [Sediminibacterium sp.]
MKDPDIEQLLKDGKGYDLNFAHVMEFLMARTIANSFLSAEILKRQIELEQLIKTGNIDHEKAALECDALCKQVADLAATEKNNVISQLYFLNKEGQ